MLDEIALREEPFHLCGSIMLNYPGGIAALACNDLSANQHRFFRCDPRRRLYKIRPWPRKGVSLRDRAVGFAETRLAPGFHPSGSIPDAALAASLDRFVTRRER